MNTVHHIPNQLKDPKAQAHKLISLVAIKAARDGQSIQSIADEGGFPRSNVSRMLNEGAMPRLDQFVRVCKAVGFQITLTEIKK